MEKIIDATYRGYRVLLDWTIGYGARPRHAKRNIARYL